MFKKIKKYLNSGKAVVLLRELIVDHTVLKDCYANLSDMSDRKIVLLRNQMRECGRGKYMNYEYYYSMESAIRTIDLKKAELYQIEETFEKSVKILNDKLTKIGWGDEIS